MRLRYKAIKELHETKGYPINALVSLLSVSRQSYYKWVKQPHAKRDTFNDFITNKIKAEFEEHKHAIGVYNMTQELNNDPTLERHVGKKLVSRIMRTHNLTCRVRIKKHNRIKRSKQYLQDNILNQHFSVDRPGEVWLSDMTELTYGRYNEHTVRLSGVLDLYGRHLVSYNLSPTETTAAVIETFDKAYEVAGDVHPLIHTDRGSAYTAKQFDQYVILHGSHRSMSRPGTPHDNSPMERWWNDFKLIWMEGHARALTLEALESLVDEGIHYMNNAIHSDKRHGLTPEEYWRQGINNAA